MMNAAKLLKVHDPAARGDIHELGTDEGTILKGPRFFELVKVHEIELSLTRFDQLVDQDHSDSNFST